MFSDFTSCLAFSYVLTVPGSILFFQTLSVLQELLRCMSIPCLILWELATTHGPCWSVDQVPTFHVGTMWPSLSQDTADCILNRLLTQSEPAVLSILGILGLDIENLVKGCWVWDLRSQVRAIKRRAIEPLPTSFMPRQIKLVSTEKRMKQMCWPKCEWVYVLQREMDRVV